MTFQSTKDFLVPIRVNFFMFDGENTLVVEGEIRESQEGLKAGTRVIISIFLRDTNYQAKTKNLDLYKLGKAESVLFRLSPSYLTSPSTMNSDIVPLFFANSIQKYHLLDIKEELFDDSYDEKIPTEVVKVEIENLYFFRRAYKIVLIGKSLIMPSLQKIKYIKIDFHFGVPKIDINKLLWSKYVRLIVQKTSNRDVLPTTCFVPIETFEEFEGKSVLKYFDCCTPDLFTADDECSNLSPLLTNL